MTLESYWQEEEMLKRRREAIDEPVRFIADLEWAKGLGEVTARGRFRGRLKGRPGLLRAQKAARENERSAIFQPQKVFFKEKD